MVFALLVSVKLRAATDVPKLLAAFEPLRVHSVNNEPNTLTYEILRDVASDRSLLILERYATEDDLVVTHCNSEPYKTFLEAVGALDIVEELSQQRLSTELLTVNA